MSNSTKPQFSVDRAIGTDLAKLDAYLITPEEYEQLPEIMDESMVRATSYIATI